MTLDFKDDKFSGKNPQISFITNMRLFLLRQTELEDLIPTKLKSISIMDLSHNNFSSPIPTCLNIALGRK